LLLLLPHRSSQRSAFSYQQKQNPGRWLLAGSQNGGGFAAMAKTGVAAILSLTCWSGKHCGGNCFPQLPRMLWTMYC